MVFFCEICHIRSEDNEDDRTLHKHSVQHKFNVLLRLYNNHKRRFMSEGTGKIDLRVQLMDKTENMKISYVHSEIKIQTPLAVLNEIKEVVVTIELCNISMIPITITSFTYLHPYPCFAYDDLMNALINNKYAKLLAGKSYKLNLKFSPTDLIVGCFMNTFSFTCQMEGSEKVTYVNRDFSIKVYENEDEDEIQNNSPFSNIEKKYVRIVESCDAFLRNQQLQQYTVPKVLKDIFTTDFEIENIPEALKYVLAKVNKSNHALFFHCLLWFEETAETEKLKRYNMNNAPILVLDSNVIKINVPGLAEKRPSLIKNDIIIISMPNDTDAYEGVITKVNSDSIFVKKFNLNFMESLENSEDKLADVQFRLNRLMYIRLHEAVDRCAHILPTLFPEENLVHRVPNFKYKISDEDIFNKSIVENPEQRETVMGIINGSSKPAPYIVFGPPGTGKTVTIVEAILQIRKHVPHAKILICAPSNAACNMLALKLGQHCNNREMIRIFAKSFDPDLIPKQIVPLSNIDDGEYIYIKKTEISKYPIVITTLVLIGKYKDSYRPDFVFIDEAAQASEPESLAALSLMNAEGQVVLCGDPKQSGPVAHSNVAKKYSLGISLLERLYLNHSMLYSNNHFTVMLKQNFRSHPLILNLPNRLFYGGLLQACSSDALRDPIATTAIYDICFQSSIPINSRIQAIEFCAIQARERQEVQSPSYYNPREIEAVMKYVQKILTTNFQNMKINEKDIGVITPYIAQVYRIRRKLETSGFKDVEVGSTEAFQGREKRIIIISTVRAQENLLLTDKEYQLGFIVNEQRFNVAITRAMSKLIIIGNPNVLQFSDPWLRLIKQCQEHGSYFGAPFAERTDELRRTIMKGLE